jgi:hypothetical protein
MAIEIPNQDRVGITQLFLNPNSGEEWDMVIVDGQIITISNTEYITQKLKQLLLTGFGEVKTNTEYGVPWLTDILGIKNPNLDSITTIILDVIEEDEILKELGVASAEIPVMELNKETRNLTMNIVLKLDNDTEVLIDGIVL